MTSVFGWLDHDDGERRRMVEVINLFREKGTLDELGIGTIRDTLADHFFPGTSTIQTRARYFLFVPWIYQIVEEQRSPTSSAGRKARELQGALVRALKAGGESQGVIGLEAGEALQRLPSAIYWQGLRRWGIATMDGSAERYHASLGARDRTERVARASDGGELIDPARRNWHLSLPPRPNDLLTATSFALSANEADFLTERIRRTAPDSLLAACLTGKTTRKASARAPWEIGGIEHLPAPLATDIEQARRFSLAMEGAALLYNHMLAEVAAERGVLGKPTLVDRYRMELGRWADEMHAEEAALASWDLQAWWSRLRSLNPSLPHRAVAFADAWIAVARATPGSVADLEAARTLIRARERQTKGPLARLHNPRALERWSGESGLGRLTFRWGNAKQHVLDILRGTQQPQELP